MLASFLFFLLAGNSHLNQVDIWRSLVIFIVDKNDKMFYYNKVKLRSKQSFISWQLLMLAFFFFFSQLEIHTLIKSIFGGVLANITIEKKGKTLCTTIKSTYGRYDLFVNDSC